MYSGAWQPAAASQDHVTNNKGSQVSLNNCMIRLTIVAKKIIQLSAIHLMTTSLSKTTFGPNCDNKSRPTYILCYIPHCFQMKQKDSFAAPRQATATFPQRLPDKRAPHKLQRWRVCPAVGWMSIFAYSCCLTGGGGG